MSENEFASSVRVSHSREPTDTASLQVAGAFPSDCVKAGLLTSKQAARYLSISERTLFDLKRNGVIPFVRVGLRSVRYAIADLERAIDQARQCGDE